MTPKHDQAAARMTDDLHDRIVAHYAPLIAAALADTKGLRKVIAQARRTYKVTNG